MLRRKFVACLAGVAAWPLAVHAQQPNKLRRIGVLELIDDPMIRSVILPELAQRGFVDGRNLIVDVRIGKSDEMPKLARELVAANPEVIIAASDWALHAALDASKLIPIVASPMGADPVVAGVAVSWARPGGNVTGVSLIATELEAKRLDLLRKAVPGIRRVATLSTHREVVERGMATIRAGSVKAGIELAEFWVDEPQEYSAAFAAMRSARVDALLIMPTPEMYRDVEQVSALALESRLPTICGFSEEKGCLVSYGPNFTELRQQTAEQVAKILQGANASELPFQGPTRFEFAINLKTAHRLGLTLPPDLLLSADKVIE